MDPILRWTGPLALIVTIAGQVRSSHVPALPRPDRIPTPADPGPYEIRMAALEKAIANLPTAPRELNPIAKHEAPPLRSWSGEVTVEDNAEAPTPEPGHRPPKPEGTTR